MNSIVSEELSTKERAKISLYALYGMAIATAHTDDVTDVAGNYLGNIEAYIQELEGKKDG